MFKTFLLIVKKSQPFKLDRVLYFNGQLLVKVSVNVCIPFIYWSKFPTDQPGLCRFFQETQNSKKSENSDNKTGNHSSFKITTIYFQKKSLCMSLCHYGLALSTVSLTGNRDRGDDNKHYGDYRKYCVW